MTLKVRDLILNVLQDGKPKHAFNIYQKIQERYQRKLKYSSTRRVLGELLGEGKVRRLSLREVEELGLQIEASPSGRSGWQPPFRRNYYLIE